MAGLQVGGRNNGRLNWFGLAGLRACILLISLESTANTPLPSFFLFTSYPASHQHLQYLQLVQELPPLSSPQQPETD